MLSVLSIELSMQCPRNLPIGVLFDLLHCNKSLPVDITVHFTGYPEGEILPCKSLSTVSEHFFHCLKEACFLKYGSSANVMNMAQSVHKKIEQSLVTADYKTFDEASKEILRGGEGKNNTQRLPVRIFLGDGVGSTGQCSVIQPSLSLKCPKGNPHTLQSALEKAFPSIVVENLEVLVQGIHVPWDSNVLWLCDNLCHADQFLYVILKIKNAR